MNDVLALMRRHRRALSVAMMLLLVALGFAAMEAVTRELTFHQVRASIRALPGPRLAAAAILTALSYLTLTLYDWLALRIIARPLPWRTAALASFTSYTLSHNLGLSLLTGGSARYRIYSRAGLDGPDVARVIAIASATFWVGIVTVAGIALTQREGAIVFAGVALPQMVAHALGLAIVALAVALVVACGRARRPVRLWRFTLPLPTARQALAQIGIAVLDTAAAAARAVRADARCRARATARLRIGLCARRRCRGADACSRRAGRVRGGRARGHPRRPGDGVGGADRLSPDLLPAAAGGRGRDPGVARGRGTARPARPPAARGARRGGRGSRRWCCRRRPSWAARCCSCPARCPRCTRAWGCCRASSPCPSSRRAISPPAWSAPGCCCWRPASTAGSTARSSPRARC
ncbi:lysylphosphatidylglycerol synthase transmembrane domain-containing protein [Sphingomonas adhaesiva]|uniref:lysylphosphatidylglycerol synthase transmembrane domain-containing protein n=1 Tax=Sphingomonas adhaesiva TaxID=28212 RepID=UPI002FFA8EC5